MKPVKYLPLVFFGIITLALSLLKPPFWDEAHAWMISKSFNLVELFQIEKYDGHLFLWHTILFPFSKNNLWYPYSMYIINWLFCLAALVIFWNKAPFSNLQKFLITFSYPFLFYFAPVARCYSIGIFFLFLLLSLWNKKVCHPILFSAILVLSANTSAAALIAGFPLGLIFIYDFIKNKPSTKNVLPVFLILAIGAISVIAQLLGAKLPTENAMRGNFISMLAGWFFLFDPVGENYKFYIIDRLFSLVVLILLYFSLFSFWKAKRAFFFFIVSFSLMTYIFTFKYTGSWWNYLFYFVDFICAVWLYKIEKAPLNKGFLAVFNIFLFLIFIQSFIFPFNLDKTVYKSEGREIAHIIKEKGLFKPNDKIYALDAFSETSVGILPFFPNVIFLDPFSNVKYSKKGFKNYYYRSYSVDNLANSLNTRERNIVITDFPVSKLKGQKYEIILSPVYISKKPKFCVFEAKRKSLF